MLFAYPVAATQENWLHDCLVAAVKAVHQLVKDGEKIPKWPNIIDEEHRDKLAGRVGLADRFKAYAEAINSLSNDEHEAVLLALEAQNRIPELLGRQCDCEALSALPLAIREPVKALFTFGFDLLTQFEVRQRQYEIICNAIEYRVCPFCGCENLDAPGAPQEDLDHYIPRSKYPFAAVNLHNLAPMGGKCNSSYKRTQDPLHRTTGERRVAIDPYGMAAVSISLDNSIVDELSTGPVVSEWVIDLLPAGEAADTWDEIFHLRERWKRDVLDEKTIGQWLGGFQKYCQTAALHIAGDVDLIGAVSRYEQYLADGGFSDRAFLKAAVFRFVLRRCAAGCSRLLPILRDLAGVPQPQ